MSPALLSVALVAGGALAFEVLLTRVLAIMHWHHFASMVISLALLGYGASGSAMMLLLDRLRPHSVLAFAGLAVLFGITAVTAVAIAQAVPFNALEVIWRPRQGLWLAVLYLLFATPFFFAASCTALALATLPSPIGRIYRFDLLGAGTGALGAAVLLSVLQPQLALPLIVASGPIAGAIVLARAHRYLATLAAFVAIALVYLPTTGWPALRMSPFKPLPQMLLVEGTDVIAERPSPIGLIQVLKSERIPFRNVSGLSLMSRQEPAPQLGLFIDGQGPAPITRFTGDWETLGYLDQTLAALPYRLLERPRVVLLGLGGGTDLLMALRHAARRVDVVEPDAGVADLLRGELGAYTGWIVDRPEVQLHFGGARHFITAAGGSYDLIMLDATAGDRSTLAESFATTVEAFASYLEHLRPEGLLVLPHPLRLPPRESLKLVLTALEALERLGAMAPPRHLALIRSWDSILLLVRRSPFEPGDLATIERFAEELAFDLGWHPEMQRDAADRFNILGEPVFFDAITALASPHRQALVAAYAFDIRPASDDRPYFGDFFRWRALPALWTAARQGGSGLLDWAWPMQLATLGFATLFSFILILVPARLMVGPGQRQLLGVTAGYFLLIGLGFLFTEIAVMQRVVLLLGEPVHAFAVTIAAFLIFAGMGSGMAARLQRRSGDGGGFWGSPEITMLSIAGLALLYTFGWPWLLAASPELGIASRALLAIALIGPLAFAMGLPFPLVLARLKRTAPTLVPWAWGVNGCASVIAAILAAILAMSFGNRVLTVSAVLAYLLAALVQRHIRCPASVPSAREL